MKRRTVQDVDWSLERSRVRLLEYRLFGETLNTEIELMVVDRLLDEHLSFMRGRRG